MHSILVLINAHTEEVSPPVIRDPAYTIQEMNDILVNSEGRYNLAVELRTNRPYNSYVCIHPVPWVGMRKSLRVRYLSESEQDFVNNVVGAMYLII